ncbi:uncharacterized protein LOC108099846 [Drosophila ficusphila]|uniref:uncharacterized protein LOC108099846 n=1 Tax=Drosophila ficusphila TaxID=30025 RepID=UPI0007E8000B|nr:uncharacterized protein LOC108099846 [Drosophila ficusphila]
MRPKDHPDLRFDVIPKLYDVHFKVFITSLCHVQEQLHLLPRRFCGMYTTRPLANQLFVNLKNRNANIKEKDFHLVEECEPFSLILSDGKRLEAMFCSGSHLGNSLILFIRRQQGGKLLYCYSAARLENLGALLGNRIFNSWISEGTDQLYLNLSSVNFPFEHVDFDEVAKTIEEYGKKRNNSVVHLDVPFFGYEEMLWLLAHTRLRGHIRLDDKLADSYKCLSDDLERFQQKDYVTRMHVGGSLGDAKPAYHPRKVVSLDIKLFKWSPKPTRMHLRQLCSLLRPEHIQAIVNFHSDGVVPPIPSFLKVFKPNYLPPIDYATAFNDLGFSQERVERQGPFREVRTKNRCQFLDDGDESSCSD